MRTDANQERRPRHASNISDGHIALTNMNAIRAARERDVRTIINNHAHTRGARGRNHRAHAFRKFMPLHVLLAHLNAISTAGDRCGEYFPPRMNAQRFGEQHAYPPLATRGASHAQQEVAFGVVGAVAQLLQRTRCNRVDRLHAFFKRPQRFAETLTRSGSHMVVT